MFKPIPLGEQPDILLNQDWNKFHNSCLVNLHQRPPRPPVAISIGTDHEDYNGMHFPLRYGTFGNISMIKGEEKARKSFLKSLLLACAIGGKANNYSDEIRGHNLDGKYIIDIDTEQGEYDCYLNAIRIPNMVGDHPPNYIPIQLRERKKSEIRGYLEWLFMESEYSKNLGIVAIDGYVDCIEDFNNQKESDEFTRDLMRWSSQSKSHVTGVLHLNPGTEKARGHLGTILQQKCETVVTIKDRGDYSEVICNRARGKRFDNFCIRINSQWLPYVSEDIPEGLTPVNQ